MKKIIVDIDNTLWDFASQFWKELIKINPEIPDPTHWCSWDFWTGYVPPKFFYEAVRRIHEIQDKFPPYKDAQLFLKKVSDLGCTVIIASHREKDTLDVTIRWLKKNELPFNDIVLCRDKSVIFPGCRAIIDDSPIILEKAKKAGIVRTGLLHPWNAMEDHPLFENLSDVYNHLQNSNGRSF